MKKSLIALAVAGAISSPAFAATSNVDIYGLMHVAIEDGNGNQDMEVIDRVSRLGMKGSEDLGGGLKAIWQIETGLGTDDGDVGGNTTFANRNTYVGLSGGFGTILMGRHDTPYKMSTGKLDPFVDTLGDYNKGGVLDLGYINAAHDYRSPQVLAYLSPNFSGLSLSAAVIAGSNSDLDKAVNPDSIDGISAALSYENGPLFATLAYQKVDKAPIANVAITGVSTTTTTSTGTVNVAFGQSKAWKAGVGYAFGNLKLAATYERTSTDVTLTGFIAGAGDVDTKSWGLNAVYQMGNIALKAAYMDMNLDLGVIGEADSDRFILGADYSLSKRTTAYVAYSSDDRDDLADKVTKYGVGVKHSF